MLPTIGNYMLENEFIELLGGKDAPKDPLVWEISRLAIMPNSTSNKNMLYLNRITANMFDAIVQFADRFNISSYIYATSTALERMLKKSGLPVERINDSKRLGKVESVACMTVINNKTRQAISEANRYYRFSKDIGTPQVSI